MNTVYAPITQAMLLNSMDAYFHKNNETRHSVEKYPKNKEICLCLTLKKSTGWGDTLIKKYALIINWNYADCQIYTKYKPWSWM